MNKMNLLGMNVVFFFATSRGSGLASIVTAIKLSKISAGAEPPLVKPLGGGAWAPQAPQYSTPMPISIPLLICVSFWMKLWNNQSCNNKVTALGLDRVPR